MIVYRPGMAGVVGGNYMECEALLFFFRFVCVVSGSGVLIVEGVEELVLGFFKKLGELFGAVG